jgi:hypothetical protein
MSSKHQVSEWLKKKLPSNLVEVILFMSHETMNRRLSTSIMSKAIEVEVTPIVLALQNGNKWSVARYMYEDLTHINEAAFCIFYYGQVLDQVTHSYVSRYFFNSHIYEDTTEDVIGAIGRVECDSHGNIKYASVVVCGYLSNVSHQDVGRRLKSFALEEGAIRILGNNLRDLRNCVMFNNKLYCIEYMQTERQFLRRFGHMRAAH